LKFVDRIANNVGWLQRQRVDGVGVQATRLEIYLVIYWFALIIYTIVLGFGLPFVISFIVIIFLYSFGIFGWVSASNKSLPFLSIFIFLGYIFIGIIGSLNIFCMFVIVLALPTMGLSDSGHILAAWIVYSILWFCFTVIPLAVIFPTVDCATRMRDFIGTGGRETRKRLLSPSQLQQQSNITTPESYTDPNVAQSAEEGRLNREGEARSTGVVQGGSKINWKKNVSTEEELMPL